MKIAITRMFFLGLMVSTFAFARADRNTLTGVLDGVGGADQGFVMGWACDTSAPYRSIDVHIYVDRPSGAGYHVATAKTYSDRPDVAKATPCTGPNGFLFHVPRRYRDGRPHTVWAYAISPTNPHVHKLLGQHTFRMSSFGTTGATDAAQHGRISGWVCDPAFPLDSIDAAVFIDGPKGYGTFAGRTYAGNYRPDVIDRTLCKGNHGFDFRIPKRFRDGRFHTAYVYALAACGTVKRNRLIGKIKFRAGRFRH